MINEKQINSLETAYLDDETFKNVQDNFNLIDFKSGLQVFIDHRGFRRGEVHTLVGTKGSGKSTWSKTILSELAASERGVLLYISEENREKYVLDLNRCFRLNNNTSINAKRYLDNIIVKSELDFTPDEPEIFFETIEKIIELGNIECFVFDNFTTAYLSELPIQQQSKLLRRFKELANKCNIPVVLFFHTSKKTNTKDLDGDSVRGSATAINVGSYNYVIYQHKTAMGIRNFIYTEKARYHNKANKQLYEAMYNVNVGMFTSCRPLTMEEYKDIISEKYDG